MSPPSSAAELNTTVFAPGRVNLIGDHTDYAGGFVLPLAVDLGTTIAGTSGGDTVTLRSADEPDDAIVPLDVVDPTAVQPAWARYVAGVVAELRPSTGFVGQVTTTLPVGAGLSSSTALSVAVALALGVDLEPLALAHACQRAESRSSGVPGGIMDQVASAMGAAGHALLIDCTTLAVTRVPVPDGAAIAVVHSGEPRRLAESAYAERRAQCEAAASIIGPLRDAAYADIGAIDDDIIRRRARHVITENARVLAASGALRAGDLAAVGRFMVESHASLRDDFAVSTAALDALVDRLLRTPGVHGARLTGAGFGGCVVALCEPGTRIEGAWWVRPSDGARVLAG